MRFAQFFPLLAVIVLAFGCEVWTTEEALVANSAHAMAKGEVHEAVCVLQAMGGSGVTGTIRLTQDGDAVRVHGEVRGLTPGKHGFHVHQYGDLTAPDGTSAGDHFAMPGQPHGRPDSDQRHLGDMGNIEAGADGVARVDYRDPHLALGGTHSVLGRAVVVHAKEDKFTQPSGDAGGRIAVGVIGIARPATGDAQQTGAVAPGAGQPQYQVGQEVALTGRLQHGVMAVGGETTGTVLHTPQGTFELELRDPSLAELLNGQDVKVRGTYDERKGVELQQRRLVRVTQMDVARAQ